ncbi:MAG: DUF2911 domain-containing protein, partial [Gemmatimonadales bacterium]|nr:DUF2911 domain-containing protein [Gemmatimonadales bacterium]
MLTMTLMALLTASPLAATPCASRASGAQLAARPSPLDSVTATIGGVEVKVCYSRPYLKGRAAVGGTLVPFGKIWRTGANEPTVIHTSAPIMIGRKKFPKIAGMTGIRKKKTIIMPCCVKTLLYVPDSSRSLCGVKSSSRI